MKANQNFSSPGQFITRISNYLARWMKLAKVPEDYDNLRRLVITEQFINMCPKDLSVHLKERTLNSIKDIASSAEKFLEAHGKSLSGKKEERKHGNEKVHQKPESKPVEKQCHNCQRKGHLKHQCRQKGGGNEVRCTTCGLYGHETSKCRRSSSRQLAAANFAQPTTQPSSTQTEVGALC